MNRRTFEKTLVAASVIGFSMFAPLVAADDDPATESRLAAPAMAGNAKWSLRLPPDGHVVYRGVVSFDEAGTGAGAMMYPAPSVAGLLAAVITHGVIVDSTRRAQKDKLQADADRVLSPYRVVLDNFNYRDLMRRAVQRTSAGASASLIEDSGDPDHEMVVESAPIFSLTQDQKAIVLDNTIAMRPPGVKPEAAYLNTIRVVSTARDLVDPTAFWTANDGEKLRDESAQLVAESLDIAFRDMAAAANPEGVSYKTIRYREGAAEKIERAQVLNDKCDRLLIRTLRGTLMSVPASRSTTVAFAADRCGPSATSQN